MIRHDPEPVCLLHPAACLKCGKRLSVGEQAYYWQVYRVLYCAECTVKFQRLADALEQIGFYEEG